MTDDTSHFRFSLLLREIDNLLYSDDVSAIALVLIQLDGLDDVNDSFGYLGGDKVLEEFSHRLDQVTREQDQAFEINGTSFAMLIKNPIHEGHAVLGAEKIAQVARDPVSIGSGKARVKARMGISLLPKPAESAEELLRQCEKALVMARKRDEHYVVYTADLADDTSNLGCLTLNVDEALKNDEMELHFQPKINLRSGQLIGAEALIRWESPTEGVIPPGLFIPEIENSPSIRSLLWFVLNSGLRSASQWLQNVPGFSLAINIAPANLEDKDLIEIIEGALSIWNYPADRLILEITETALMNDPGANFLVLSRLKKLGVRISIDDFGTGYSSLAYLKNIPADELKVDKSFIKPITTDEIDRKIVAAVIQLAHALDLNVTAEGIETADAMRMLVAMGVENGQGYHFDAPMPAKQFVEKWISIFSRENGEARSTP